MHKWPFYNDTLNNANNALNSMLNKKGVKIWTWKVKRFEIFQ